MKTKRNLLTKLSLFAMALVCSIGLMGKVDAFALSAPTNVAQVVTDQSDTHIQVAYTTPSSYVYIRYVEAAYYRGDASTAWNYTSNDGTQYSYTSDTETIFGLKAGTTYIVEVGSASSRSTNANAAVYCAPIEANTAPDYITSLTQTNATLDNVTVTWPAVYGATGYTVYRATEAIYSDESKLQKIGNVATNSATVAGFGRNTCPYVYVIPYRTSAKNPTPIYADSYRYLQCTTLPTAPTNIRPTYRSSSLKQIGFSYDISACKTNMDGAEVLITNASGKKIASGDAGVYTSINYIKNAKLFKQPFKYQVRAYFKLANGTKLYGPWSAAKVFIPDAKAKQIKRSYYASSGTLTFEKIKGATSYTVYHSTNGKKWKVVAKNVKGSSAYVPYSRSAAKNYYYIKSNKVKFGKKKLSSVAPGKAVSFYYV